MARSFSAACSIRYLRWTLQILGRILRGGITIVSPWLSRTSTSRKGAFGHDIITDLVDRIPVGEDGDANGNIADATRSRLAGTLSIDGDTFGLDGAQLDLRGTWQWSSVIDPIESRACDLDGPYFKLSVGKTFG